MCRRALSKNLWVGGLHLFDAHVSECAAASRQDNLLHAAFRDPLHALENSRVLGIHWQHADAIFLEHRSDDRAAGNQRLFVGEGDVLASFDRLNGGDEPRATDDARDDGFGLLACGYGDLALLPAEEFRRIARDAQGGDAGLQLVQHRGIASHDQRPPLLDLLEQQPHVLASGERHWLTEARVLSANVQRLRANAPRRTQDGDLFVLRGDIGAFLGVGADEVAAP
mmetsp:Transcript_57695/g.167115  ORF Transcript_57695/g.167115 Transcript_57695/m.167115 type:complete len:225 (-) Transcript_57695:347-1021(-)